MIEIYSIRTSVTFDKTYLVVIFSSKCDIFSCSLHINFTFLKVYLF